MALFFTSDTHFGDHRTLNIHKRPFATTMEMDELLIARWNEVVGAGDEIWHLGDFARRAADVPHLLARLNGGKHLIMGNNDPPGTVTSDGWESVAPYRELQVEGIDLVLCHYPFRSWNGQHRKAINLHGHSHGRLKPMPRQYDVGTDAHGFRPVTLDSIMAAAGAKAASADKKSLPFY